MGFMNRLDTIIKFTGLLLAYSIAIYISLVFIFGGIAWLTDGLFALPKEICMGITKLFIGVAAAAFLGLVFSYFIENIFFMRRQVKAFSRKLGELRKDTELLFWPANSPACSFLIFILQQIACLALSWFLGKWIMGFSDLPMAVTFATSYVVLFILAKTAEIFLLTARSTKLAEQLKVILKESNPVLLHECENLKQEISARDEEINKLRKLVKFADEASRIRQVLPNDRYIGYCFDREGNTTYFFGDYVAFCFDIHENAVILKVTGKIGDMLKVDSGRDLHILDSINKTRLRDIILSLARGMKVTKFEAAHILQEELDKRPLLAMNGKARECLDLLLAGENPFTLKFNKDNNNNNDDDYEK